MAQEYAGLVNGPEQVQLNFRFQINSTSNPDNLVPAKQGVTSVTRISTGLFDVLMTRKYPQMVRANAGLLAASASGIKCEVVSYTASTGMLRLRCVSGGSLTTTVAYSLAIAVPTFANLLDADFITIGDGVNPAVKYEFDRTNDGVAAGSVDVGAHTATTAADVAALLKTAINTNQPSLIVTDNLNGTLSIVQSLVTAIITATESISHASGTAVVTAGTPAVVVNGNAVVDPADNDWVHVSAAFCRFSNLAPSGAI